MTRISLTHALFLAVAAAVALGLPADAMAQGILNEAYNRVSMVSNMATNVVYLIGTIGLVVLGVFAFFGRFKWAHFFALAGGIFLVALANQLFGFLRSGM
jgi:type IV secretory pathway VirB2 component (pilin)